MSSPTSPPSRPYRSSLVIRNPADREFKIAHPPRQLPVYLRIGVKSVVHAATFFLVKYNLQYLAAVFLGANALTHNLHWVYNIGQDRIMHSRQGSRAWALLSLAGSTTVGALGAREDAAGGEDQDMAVGKLLLEFTR